MLSQKIKILLLIAVGVIAITALAVILIGGSGKVIAQTDGSVIETRQEANGSLRQQNVYTNPNVLNLPTDTQAEVGQVEKVEDLESALSSADIDPQSTLSGSEHVPPSAFRSDGFAGAAVGYRFSVLGGTFPGGYIRNNSANSLCMAAPVYLPHGKTVTEFSIFFMDDHPTLNLDSIITLWRKDLNVPGNAAEIMADFNSPAIDSTSIIRGFDNTISNAVVNNQYSYYITFCFYANTGLQHLIYGFKVDYN